MDVYNPASLFTTTGSKPEPSLDQSAEIAHNSGESRSDEGRFSDLDLLFEQSAQTGVVGNPPAEVGMIMARVAQAQSASVSILEKSNMRRAAA